MSFKKILSMLLVFCMFLSLTACAGKNTDDEDDSKSASGKKDGIFTQNNDSNSKDGDTTSEDNDNKPNPSNTDSGNGTGAGTDNDPYKGLKEVELPKDYPKDAFPVYNGGLVYAADSSQRDGFNAYSVMAVFNTDLDTVSKFYKEKLKDAEDFKDQSSGGFIVYTGKMKGYEFIMTLLSDSNNDKASLITLELTEIPSAAKLLETLAEGELPDKYPNDLFPIIDGGALNSSSESESDGKVYYELTIYTDKSFKDIVAFYEGKIGAIEEKDKSLSTDDFNLDGKAHKYYFRIYGGLTEEKNVTLTRYYLSLDPVTDE